MTVGNVIEDIELALAGRGLTPRPNPETIRQFIKSKWLEVIGETHAQDQKFTLTTDGTRELELPSSVKMVTRVYVDNRRAIKTTDVARDNAYANYQADL